MAARVQRKKVLQAAAGSFPENETPNALYILWRERLPTNGSRTRTSELGACDSIEEASSRIAMGKLLDLCI